ncbi:MAG: TMEM165/GDT1 family protein, partial [Cyanobacteria bacterium J06573_2]
FKNPANTPKAIAERTCSNVNPKTLKNPIGVSVGAILGHAICAAIAVTFGRILAGQITERQLTAAGGCLFIIFGVVAIIQGV